MSCYFTEAKRPDKDHFEPVAMQDDYFGPNQYGVMFADGTVMRESGCEVKTPSKETK